VNQPEWWLLFFLAIVIGYIFGRRDGRRRQMRREENLSRDYIRGLNYLLNEQPDKAIEIFVKSLAVSEHTLETHLALAKVFRRRGELDRATLIHSNLLEHPQLPAAARDDVQLELAQDFLAAGVLDRAEDILQKLLDRGSRHDVLVMRLLLSLFEQEKDWHSAISVAERLLRHDQSVAPVLAHYHCELAERMLQREETGAARRTLRRALQLDSNCVRASLLQGRLEMAEQQWESAMRALRRVRRQDAGVFDEVLDDLELCYQALDRLDQYTQYLTRLCVEAPSTAIVLKLTERLRSQFGDKAASLFIADHVKSHPSVGGLKQIIDIHARDADGSAQQPLVMMKQLADQLLQQKTLYQCRDCGLEVQRRHWQCPSCKHWGTFKPHPHRDV
jgi:lipopolysaccharide assembly protein B